MTGCSLKAASNLCAVGPDVRLRPLARVQAGHRFAVQLDRDRGLVAGDDRAVPLADRLHRVLRRFDPIVQRPGVVEPGLLGVVEGDLDAVDPTSFPGRGVSG